MAVPQWEVDYISPPSSAASECRPDRAAIHKHVCFEASLGRDTDFFFKKKRKVSGFSYITDERLYVIVHVSEENCRNKVRHIIQYQPF